MKRAIYFVIVMFFTLSTTMVFANKSDSGSENETTVPVKTEKQLSDDEVERITERVKEIRTMDKSDLTTEEKIELKKELKEMKRDVKKAGQGIYIGGTGLIIIIILLILLV